MRGELKKLRRMRKRHLIAAVLYAVVALVLAVASVVAFAAGKPVPGWTESICAVLWAVMSMLWVRNAHQLKGRIHHVQEVQARLDAAALLQSRINALHASLGPAGGGYWRGTQAHRTGAGGGSGNSAGGAAGGTSTSLTPRMIPGGLAIYYAGRRVPFVAPGEFDAKTQIELAPGVVRGSRSFRVAGAGQLTGVSFQYVWRSGENDAKCLALAFSLTRYSGKDDVLDGHGEHDMTTCKHGFYGYYDGSDDFHHIGMVSGVIEGYGETVIGSRGFRCMKARIVALHVPPEVPAGETQLIRERYSDAVFFDSFGAMINAFPPDAPGEDLRHE